MTISREVFRKTIRFFLAPVVEYLDDESVREIMINGKDEIFIERKGLVEKANVRFASNDDLMAAATNIGQYVGRHLSWEEPRFDARLPEGHRVHVITPPLCRNGVSITIRKHSTTVFTLDDWIARGSLTPEAKALLTQVVTRHQNLIVSGGTGTGKTTLLNSLTGLIPPGERVLTIEDSAELQIQSDHVLSLEARPPDRRGRGAQTIRHLFHSALRMRPDRVIIGECRGGEALDMIQAMNSGHGGSMSTLHANSTSEALKRLETLALFAGEDIPLRFMRAQVAGAINVIVQLQRLKGRRIVQAIAENRGLDDKENYIVNNLFEFDHRRGELLPTGLKASWEEGGDEHA